MKSPSHFELCCPSPNFPSVAVDADTKWPRFFLGCIMFLLIPYEVCSILLNGPLQGIAAVLFVWIAYWNYASMHFFMSLVGALFFNIELVYLIYAMYYDLGGAYLYDKELIKIIRISQSVFCVICAIINLYAWRLFYRKTLE